MSDHDVRTRRGPGPHDGGSTHARVEPRAQRVDPGQLVDSSPDAVVVLDDAGRVVYGNPASAELLGVSIEDGIGTDALAFVHPDDVLLVLSSMGTVRTKPRGTPIEVRLRDPNGGWRLVEVIGRDCRDVPGVGGLVCTMRDLTRRRMWEVAANDLTRFQHIVQHAATIVLCLDPEGVVTSVNAAFQRVLGHDPEQVVGRRLADFAAPGRVDQVVDAIRDAHERGSIVVEVDMMSAHLVGPVPIRFEIVDLVDDPVVAGVVVTGQDVSDLQAARRQLEYMARHDPLTGLPNRTVLDAHLRHLADTGIGFGLLYVDLDGFKGVNDEFGHDAGDELLRRAGQRIGAAVKTSDLVCRIGGDEFVVVLSGVQDPEEAQRVAGRVSQSLAEPFDLRAGTVNMSGSVGAAISSDDCTGGNLLEQADRNMYAEKTLSRIRLRAV